MGTALYVQLLKNGQATGQLQFDSDSQRTIKVGRMNSAQVKLDDPSAARIHAVLELGAGGVSLMDMGSTSGTFVNGQRAQKTKLNHGDQVSIGNTQLLVGIGTPAGAQQTAGGQTAAMGQQAAPGGQMQPPAAGYWAQPGMAPQPGPGAQASAGAQPGAAAPAGSIPTQPTTGGGAVGGQYAAPSQPQAQAQQWTVGQPMGAPGPQSPAGGMQGMPGAPAQPAVGVGGPAQGAAAPGGGQAPNGVMGQGAAAGGFQPTQQQPFMPSPDAAAGNDPSQLQPRFDPGSTAGTQEPIRRITQERLRRAAVESKPHPSLPPEQPLTQENRILEMRMYWGEVLLGMYHYDKPKKITIGESKHTDIFISSEGLPAEVFPIIRYDDGEYILSFANEMEGEVEIDGRIHPLNDLRGSSMAQKDEDYDGTYIYKMPMDSRALVHWGGATFALRFVSPAKAVPNDFFKNLDLQYVNMLLISIFFHVAAVVTFMVYPHDIASLKEDLFDRSDRFAELLLDPEKPSESNKNLLDEIKKKVEKKKTKKVKTKKPTKKLKLAKQDKSSKTPRRRKSQAQKKAEVKQQFQKLFNSGGGGAGSMLGGGGGGVVSGNLTNAIGTTGKGSAGALAGMGIRGSGPATGGGVGTSRGIAGIGTSGRLGGGGSGYGSKVGGLGSGRQEKMVELSQPRIMGALPPEVIKRVINQHKQQIRYCYEVQLQRDKDLEGRVAMRWVIGKTGKVVRVQVKESSINNANVERCIASKIRTWKFPKPQGGGIVEVNYPFVFRAT